MSNLPVGITLSPSETIRRDAMHRARPEGVQAASTGDDGSLAGAAQDRTARIRFRDREYDDRQRRLTGKPECRRVDELVAALDRLRVGQPIERPGGRVLP